MQNAECRMQNDQVEYMQENIALEKSFSFAVRIVNLYKHLTKNKQEFVLSKQLLRCGTSIGANVAEAQRGQSKADFTAKMSIALKEAYEAEYWIRLLYTTQYLKQMEYESLGKDIDEMISILMSICKTSNEKK